MSEVIKLKVHESAKQECDMMRIQEKFIEACLALDASVFEPLIDEDRTFEDLDKYRFLDSLKSNFDNVKDKRVQKMSLVHAKCMGCQRGHDVHEFHSENGFEFAYLIFWEDGKLIDIFQCNLSQNRTFEPF